MFFDSHAHYDDAAYDNDRAELIDMMKKNGVDKIINVGSDMRSSIRSIELAQKYDFIYAAVGIHPHNIQDMTEENIKLLQKYCNCYKVVAVGEIGLDYHYENIDRDAQKYWFKRQLDICAQTGRPVIIHSRNAAADSFEILKNSGVHKGVIHAFSGSPEMAKQYISLGFYIGVGGVSTYKNAKKLVETIKQIPLEKILIETDAPYLTPEPYRGQRNNSQNLRLIVERIGEIKQIPPEFVANISYENTEILFL